jgi:hypothetical protein
MASLKALLLLSFAVLSSSYRYDPAYLQYNVNENKTATDPISYWGQWDKSSFHPSPESWRFPFYTLFLDRFVNGDPSNDNINGTSFEHDLNSNQMRHGGDLEGLVDTLDYLQGFGIKVSCRHTSVWVAVVTNWLRVFTLLGLPSSISPGVMTSTRRLISPFSILTSARLQHGEKPSTRYMPAECMWCSTTPLLPLET